MKIRKITQVCQTTEHNEKDPYFAQCVSLKNSRTRLKLAQINYTTLNANTKYESDNKNLCARLLSNSDSLQLAVSRLR